MQVIRNNAMSVGIKKQYYLSSIEIGIISDLQLFIQRAWV